jgi:hypothetical protein
MRPDILYKDESYKILGACFEVHREKGCGFVEPVYGHFPKAEVERIVAEKGRYGR